MRRPQSGIRDAGFSLPTLALDKSLTEGDVTSVPFWAWR
jgi:hypothetical protein